MNHIFSHLKARALESYSDVSDMLPILEQKMGISLPRNLVTLLIEIGDAVVFEEGAKFKPDTLSSREDPDHYLALSILYGINSGDFGIESNNATLRTQIPQNLIAIGESAGGDQICLDRTSSRVFYWKHDTPEDVATTQIAPTFDDFIARLEPNVDTPEAQKKRLAESGLISFELHLDDD